MSLDKGTWAKCQAEEFRLYLEGNRDLVTDFKQEDYILRMVFSFLKNQYNFY